LVSDFSYIFAFVLIIQFLYNGAKKLLHFIFVKSFYTEMFIGNVDAPINFEQNDIRIINLS